MSYSPAIGRWMEQDPEQYIDGPNLYRAFDDNPATLTDPSGLQPNGSPAQAKANAIAQLNQAKAYLQSLVTDWQGCGYTTAADMLSHFLGNTGAPYTLSSADTDEIKSNHNFQEALWGDISANFPTAVTGGGPTPVHGHIVKYFSFDPFDNNGLFYAFGTTVIDYKGTVSSTAVRAPRGGYNYRKCYDLTVTITKPSYNFSPKTHGAADYYFEAFRDAWLLEQAGWAKAFSASGTFEMKG